MPNSVAITNTDHTAEGLKALAGRCKDKNQPRRLRAIVRVMEGEHARTEIARQACVCLCFQDEARIGQKGMPARVWAFHPYTANSDHAVVTPSSEIFDEQK